MQDRVDKVFGARVRAGKLGIKSGEGWTKEKLAQVKVNYDALLSAAHKRAHTASCLSTLSSAVLNNMDNVRYKMRPLFARGFAREYSGPFERNDASDEEKTPDPFPAP